MLVFVRFMSETGIDPSRIEEAVQGAVGRAGSVIGASESTVDIEIHDATEVRTILQALAASLRELGLSASTQLDIPSSGQRFGINDF